MTAVEIIDAEVRDVVRRQGLDPVADRGGVQKIINDVLAEYDERSPDTKTAPEGAVGPQPLSHGVVLE